MRRSRAQQHRVAAAQDEGSAAPLRPLRFDRFARPIFRRAMRRREAEAAKRTEGTGRPSRGAGRGAEIHHGLGEIAGPLGRNQQRGFCFHQRLARGQRRIDRIKPRDDPFDIAVDRDGFLPEGDRRDRRRRIRADARKQAQRRFALRKLAAMLGDDRTWRRREGCAPANNNRAQPIAASPLRSARRQVPRHSASGAGRPRNRASRP